MKHSCTATSLNTATDPFRYPTFISHWAFSSPFGCVPCSCLIWHLMIVDSNAHSKTLWHMHTKCQTSDPFSNTLTYIPNTQCSFRIYISDNSTAIVSFKRILSWNFKA